MTMTATKPLWQHAEDLGELAEEIFEAGGVLTPELEARLATQTEDIEAKVERVALYIQDLLGDAEKAKAEKDRLAQIQKAYESRAEGLKTYLVRCMAVADLEKVQTPKVRVNRQRSGTPSVEYHGDIEALPADFIRVRPEERSLDKRAVIQAIRDEEALPDGFSVTYSDFVRIF